VGDVAFIDIITLFIRKKNGHLTLPRCQMEGL